MTSRASEVIARLQGKTLGTAESCTGGGIGHALTAVPGASNVYNGGIISYCNEIKAKLLNVSEELLNTHGAVSATVAQAMAQGARKALNTDIAVSVTGLAGPSGDGFGNPVGTVFVGYADENTVVSRHFLFSGDRDAIRKQAVDAALELILENI
ncbi:MAG: CinA family protein [Ruminococcaceae bacterium]|nr:CinA family protein [Oscillospiraceae bacterium]